MFQTDLEKACFSFSLEVPLGVLSVGLPRYSFGKEKRFSSEGALLVNVVSPFSLDAVHADVYVGESRFDRQKSIIVDYSKKSLIAKFIRDEIREVRPGTLLGLAYIGRVRVLFFLLEGFRQN